MGKENVVMGTIILSASSIFVRMIGFVFRVWLAGLLGAEGMGVYTLIVSLYMLCITLSTSGISGAVSKLAAAELASGNSANAKRILWRSVNISIILSSIVCLVLLIFADQIALHVLRDTRTALSIRMLAPGLPFMSVSSCFRGYFIAARKMGNPAFSQVVEQILKMVFIIALIGNWLPKGIAYGCALVILGITVGEVVSFIITIGGYIAENSDKSLVKRANITSVTSKILQFAIPISIGSYIRSGLRLLEEVLILSGLKAFSGNDDQATGVYGMLKGMVMPLLIFPLGLLSAFVITLTPEVSRLHSTNNRPQLINTISRILQVTCIIGIFVVSIFLTFSYEIGMAIYKSAEVGQMVRAMAFLCPVMCVEMVVVSILQGMGEQISSLRYNIADCILRVVLVFVLVPFYGVNGFLFMVVASNIFTSLLNLRKLLKITKLPMQINNWIIKPSLAAAAAAQVTRLIWNNLLAETLPIWIGLMVGCFIVMVIYISVLYSVGSISKGDFAWIRRQSGRIFKKKRKLNAVEV